MTSPEPHERGMPSLGNVDAPERKCTRTINGIVGTGEVLCGKPPLEHLDWGPYTGYVCAEHREEALTRWKAQAHHVVGPYCGLPGVLWWNFDDGSSYCAYEDDLPT